MAQARSAFGMACAVLMLAAFQAHADDPPAWAYPVPPPDRSDPPEHMLSLPGSTESFSSSQLDDPFTLSDWFPEDHPPPPAMVAHGQAPSLYACGYCHLATGAGRPENAALAGLLPAYIVAQVKAFASGTRRSSVDRNPGALMIELAQPAAQAPDLEEVARYFAALPPAARIRVVEAETIPRTEIADWVMRRGAAGGTESIGERVVEVPDDFDRFEARDPRLTYTAFVPPGSVKRGELLVKTGGGKTSGCALCHGAELRGQGTAPPLAGRSPTYLARQLYDMQSGARHDPGAAAMKPVVARLGNAELVAITAYLASLPP